MYQPDATSDTTFPPVVPARRASRARRPHPARRARRFVAGASLALMLTLTGLVAQHESGSATQTVAVATASGGPSTSSANSATSGTTSPSTGTSGSSTDSSTSSSSTNSSSAATAAAPSNNATTSSHGS